jgi:hypothetical protein
VTLAHYLLSRDFCVVFTKSSIRGLRHAFFSIIEPLRAATQAAQLGCLEKIRTGSARAPPPVPYISFSSIIATRPGVYIRYASLEVRLRPIIVI